VNFHNNFYKIIRYNDINIKLYKSINDKGEELFISPLIEKYPNSSKYFLIDDKLNTYSYDDNSKNYVQDQLKKSQKQIINIKDIPKEKKYNNIFEGFILYIKYLQNVYFKCTSENHNCSYSITSILNFLNRETPFF
jgi:hypothetical protein